jgi:hypothetical protein
MLTLFDDLADSDLTGLDLAGLSLPDRNGNFIAIPD